MILRLKQLSSIAAGISIVTYFQFTYWEEGKSIHLGESAPFNYITDSFRVFVYSKAKDRQRLKWKNIF